MGFCCHSEQAVDQAVELTVIGNAAMFMSRDCGDYLFDNAQIHLESVQYYKMPFNKSATPKTTIYKSEN